MVHIFGGPYREVRCVQNGQAIFIEWPLSGLIRIVLKTGKLWDSRRGPWTMHSDDLKRITRKAEPYNTNPHQWQPRSTLPSDTAILNANHLSSHSPSVRSTEALEGLSHVRKPGQRK